MPSTNPTIVLIPGAWHTAEHFTPIETKLTKQAFPTIALTLPSSKSTSAATKSLEKDISFIKATIEPLLACGTEIILLMHSSGSISGSAAINDSMSVTERVKQDQKGGVLGLVFIAAYLLPPHTTIKQMMGTADDEGFPPWMKSGEDGNITLTTNIETRFYHDLPNPTDQKLWASRTVPCAADALDGSVGHAAWMSDTYKPNQAYIFCEDDRALPFQLQNAMVEKADFAYQVFLKSGHCPFLSVPALVAESVGGLAREFARPWVKVEKDGGLSGCVL